ncbi:hypothetical protein M404DRAFT_451002 [Pisolithus tinctorius Marx 270]|uniref:Uncharacterized protein n=1 Tax=Pisolithus tinctorius Marx 270 TaxID=870435 RepID=A0A0C3PX03_PISTI|nr:hypothetical protein M404DRAFT_451002 [Pisolithus tinctorius Marx 270]
MNHDDRTMERGRGTACTKNTSKCCRRISLKTSKYTRYIVPLVYLKKSTRHVKNEEKMYHVYQTTASRGGRPGSTLIVSPDQRVPTTEAFFRVLVQGMRMSHVQLKIPLALSPTPFPSSQSALTVSESERRRYRMSDSDSCS